MHFTRIPELWKGNIRERSLLGRYCLKDSILPLMLMQKMNTATSMMAMARVTGLDLQSLLNRGQSIRVLRQVRDVARRIRWVIPFIPRDFDAATGDPTKRIKRYQGAIVINPRKGYYLEWVITYDFASLYPSIMIAWNLCYTTLVPPRDYARMKKKSERIMEEIRQMVERGELPPEGTPEYERYRKIHDPMMWVQEPNELGHVFLQKWVRVSMLRYILVNLTACRGIAKKKMQQAYDAGDKVMESVHNADQLAIKISSNSVYGFTGASVSKLPCLEIASSVTCYGRALISKTREIVEQPYVRPEDGVEWCGGEVIYGDTGMCRIKTWWCSCV